MLTLNAPVADATSPRVPRRPHFLRYEPSRVAGEMTVSQYLQFLQQADYKYDYVFGKVVQVPGASFEHVQITFNLTLYLALAVRQVGARVRILGSDMRTLVRSRLHRFADLVAVEGAPQVGMDDELRNPTVVFEVLSELTQADDRADKFHEYQSIASLRYYVLVDQYRVNVTVYEKQDNGLWPAVSIYTRLSDILTLILDGKRVEVRLADIYEEVYDADEERGEAQETEP